MSVYPQSHTPSILPPRLSDQHYIPHACYPQTQFTIIDLITLNLLVREDQTLEAPMSFLSRYCFLI